MFGGGHDGRGFRRMERGDGRGTGISMGDGWGLWKKSNLGEPPWGWGMELGVVGVDRT
jgi:hypothetical protein